MKTVVHEVLEFYNWYSTESLVHGRDDSETVRGDQENIFGFPVVGQELEVF